MMHEQDVPDKLATITVLDADPCGDGTVQAGSRHRGDGSLRERLGELRALLVISLLMTLSASEEQILELAASSAPGFGGWQVDGYAFADGQWHPGPVGPARCPGCLPSPACRAESGQRKGRVAGAAKHAWAYPMRGVGEMLGHMVASCDREPPAEQGFLVEVLAQQTGVAVSNARLHARQRSIAEELAATNATLAETVSNLRRSMDIHQRLTQVAISGEGQPGIAKALYELTGMAVAIEDRYGYLTAWGKPGSARPLP